MRWILRILLLPVLAVNLLVALLFVGCAYSPLLPPSTVALLSLAGLAFPFVLVANVLFIPLWLVLHRRYMWLSVIACLLCLPQIRAFCPINFDHQEAPEGSLKLLSYNILSSNLTAANANKENPMIAYLEGSDADIICLQEFPFNVLKNNAKTKHLLKAYPYRSYDLSKDNELEAHALVCLSKYPILSLEKLDFNSTSNGATKYRILHEGDTIVVYNCHLQSYSLDTDNKSTYEGLLTNPKENFKVEDTKTLVKKLRDATAKRAAQADIVVADIRRETSPYVIVCGDFNDSPISYTRRQMARHLDDAFVHSGNGPGISYNRNKMYYRIDHILHSAAFDSYACTVDRSIKVSDHYPIACYLDKER